MTKVKVVLSLLLTPLVDPLVFFILQNSASEEERADYIDDTDMAKQKSIQASQVKISVQFYVMAILIFISLAQKAFREDACNNFVKDPVNDKLEMIRQKFQLSQLKK